MARISAIKALDYDWWLATWDDASREQVLKRDRAAGRNEAYWEDWWSRSLAKRTIVPAHRIETGPYVVVTYFARDERQLDTGEKDPTSDMEFPVVFAKVGDCWKVTAELSADPLVPASPWVSGEDSMEIESK